MLARSTSGGLALDGSVVLVVDQRDPVGRSLGEAAGERADLDAADEAAQVERRREIPTAIMVIEVSAARALFTEGHPAVASRLEARPAEGRVRAVVVAAGAAMLVHAEVSPMSLPLDA